MKLGMALSVLCAAVSVVPFAAAQTKVAPARTLPVASAPPSSQGYGAIPLGGPFNDDCGAPLLIFGPGPHPFDTTLATTGVAGQFEPACFFFGAMGLDLDRWYLWTSPFDGPVVLSLCGTAVFDSKVAVYAGLGCPAAPPIACNDDACGVVSELVFPAVAGALYTVHLGSFPGTPGGVGTFSFDGAPGVATCAGDGLDPLVVTACPCANFGAPGNGCANSVDISGAHLVATGSVALDTVVLEGSGMPAVAACIYLKGDASVDAGLLFGDGLRCAAGILVRLKTKINFGGASSFPEPVDGITLSVRGGTPVGSGLTAWYTAYYRNATPLFCPPASFNVANGWKTTW